MFNVQRSMFNVLVLVHTSTGVTATASVVAAGVASVDAALVITPLAIWRGVGGEAVLAVLDIAAVAGGDALQHVAVLVQTGDLDAGVLQLVLHVRVGGEDDAAHATSSSSATAFERTPKRIVPRPGSGTL